MLEKIKKNKYQILELIIIFVITLLYNLICSNLSRDEIWNYGFSYNISTGLIPYKDFNMIITPLYSIIGAIFLTIFGKSLLVYHIFNTLICTTIFYYMKKFTNINYYIIYMIFLTQAYPSYNIFCILLLYILMLMEDKNKNDYLIGIILGLTFLTKQNIGIFLCVPTLFIKDIKRMFKRGIGFIIPNIIFLIYLLITNSIYDFIDYAILGISSFAKNNLAINKASLIILIITMIYLVYKYLKNKDIKIIYLICFLLLVLPMIEPYHTMIAVIPAWSYILNDLKLLKKLTVLIFAIFILAIFSTNIYGIYKNEYTVSNITEEYKYRKILTAGAVQIKNISNYISNVQDELYIIYRNAYIVKLEANIKINKYDLLNDGNLGSGGEEKLIKEIEDNCNNKKCTFILEVEELSQNKKNAYAKDIMNHIIINYNQKERVENLLVFKNY